MQESEVAMVSKLMSLVRIAMCVVAGGLLLFSGGCETDSDSSGAEAYFANNPYNSESRGEPNASQLRVTPSTARIGVPGQQVVFTASGGSGSYLWRVSDTSVGTVHSLQTAQCYYTCKAVGYNTVRVTDRDGRWATAQVTPADDTMSITPSSVSLDLSTTVHASFAVSGGSPPYSWSVANPSLGSISYSVSASYQAAYTAIAGRYGTQVVTVRDADSRTASATVTQH